MQVRRFLAPTAREALRAIREQLGDDALILGNRPVTEGVELLAAAADQLAIATRAAVDALPPAALPPAATLPSVALPVEPTEVPPPLPPSASPQRVERVEIPVTSLPASALPGADAGSDVAAAMARLDQAAEAVEVAETVTGAPSSDAEAAKPMPEQMDVASEIRAMRGFIEEQFANMSWSESMRQPTRIQLMQDMLEAGFSPGLSRYLQQRMPVELSCEQGREWLRGALARNLKCVDPSEDLVDQGGVFALVGPTGVGKTTTIAKLAARFAFKHGVDNLALITTDSYRVGAQDQLHAYAQILGVPVQLVRNAAGFASMARHFSGKKLVLIDTAGLGQGDRRVAEQLAMLQSAKAQRILVLNATVQAETLDAVVTAYADQAFKGCILSKVDEAVCLGGALDVMLRYHLRLFYVTTGQRVPEDLRMPDAPALVQRAFRTVAPDSMFNLEKDDQAAWLARTLKPGVMDGIGVEHV